MSNDTKFILGIEDPNIKNVKISNPYINKGPLEVQGVLNYRPKACPKCGVLNRKSIINYGWRWTNVKLPRTSEREVLLMLKKRYFKCKECGQYFLAETPIVKRNRTISNLSRLACFEKMSDTVSMRHVAGELSISSTTVLRYLKSYQDDIKPQYIWLPEVICMDEIKSTKDAKGAMSFIFMDGIKHKFMDILDSRTIHDLEIYFKRYTKEARDSVKVIVTDINYTYPKLIKSVFKNAIVVTDRFHIVNLISKAFNRTRVRIMKKYASSNVKYKGLKRYWKLLLKPNEQLNFKTYYHYSFLQGLNTENSVVDRLLSYNDELKEAYEILQNVMSAIKYKDDERLDTLLNDSEPVSDEMMTVLNTFRENRTSIHNALAYGYSNGPLEGINNKIKVIKRVSYGFGRFQNFRLRIHLAFKIRKAA